MRTARNSHAVRSLTMNESLRRYQEHHVAVDGGGAAFRFAGVRQLHIREDVEPWAGAAPQWRWLEELTIRGSSTVSAPTLIDQDRTARSDR